MFRDAADGDDQAVGLELLLAPSLSVGDAVTPFLVVLTSPILTPVELQTLLGEDLGGFLWPRYPVGDRQKPGRFQGIVTRNRGDATPNPFPGR